LDTLRTLWSFRTFRSDWSGWARCTGIRVGSLLCIEHTRFKMVESSGVERGAAG
jgi:hypothetical protein